ncbi:porin family protein [Xylanibacter oryzae]|uniref:porin family protein n=1 Tax=Xylanibacter oryzae TaxID=185293 RepID=UPI0004AFDA29|nr:porin family protein [Xylanibacter oryzae]
MRKIIVMVSIVVFAIAAKAQTRVGEISIYPRVGTSISNFTNYKLGISTDMEKGNSSSLKSNFKPGFTAGLEAEYQITPVVSLSLGAMYTMLGTKFKDHTSQIGSEYNGLSNNSQATGSYYGIGDHQINLQYIDIPLLFNAYVSQGLAIKAGIQVGLMLDARAKDDETLMTKTTANGSTTITHGDTESMDYNVNSYFNKVDFSIPVGVSYEYMNVIMDARYNFGLSKIFNYTDSPNSKNSFLTVTFGYRFRL